MVTPGALFLNENTCLRRQLSKHSIGAYMEICRELGKSFEAVPYNGPVESEQDVNKASRGKEA